MLLPYNRRTIKLDDLPLEYLPTIVADMRRYRFTGFVLATTEQITASIGFAEGMEQGVVTWQPKLGVQRLTPVCTDLLQLLPDSLNIEILQAPADAVAMARIYARGTPLAGIPAILDYGVLDSLVHGQPTCVLARLSPDGVGELAMVADGKLEAGYRFNRETKRFTRVGESFWESPPNGGVRWEIVTPSLIHPRPHFETAREPLDILMEKYTATLLLAERALGAKSKAELGTLINQLLDHFKKKYPPLYRGLYRNPETGQVNWDRLIHNREHVNARYRYDKFQLYLDEIVLKYFQLIAREAGADGVNRLGKDVERLRHASPDLDFEPVRHFFAKLERLVSAARKTNNNG